MKAVERAQRLHALLDRYQIADEDYELPYVDGTSAHYGNSLKHGPLRQIVIYDHFISDASEFEAIGYGVIRRSRE